jgi:FHS family L-fucose permease-like MFS transporter
MLTALFFAWGFITCLNDILIPHLKAVFDLGYAEAMLIQMSFFAAYFVASFPCGALVDRIGFKRGIVAGLLTGALGCALFYPAAALRSYPLFLGALFVLACGITLLQVAANPLVAMLGAPERASARLTITQAFNSLGTTVAPLLGSMLILSATVASPEHIAAMTPSELETYRATEASAVQLPYLGLAGALVAAAVFFALYRLPAITGGGGTTVHAANEPASAWSHRPLVFGAIAIFMYVGAEVAIGSFLVSFLGQRSVAGLEEEVAGKYLSFYWGGAMIGRFLGSVTLSRFKPGHVLLAHAALAGVLVLAAMTLPGALAMWTLLAVGLCNSIMFPTIFAMALDGLGRHTSRGSGILCMGIVGGAIVPFLQGLLADAADLRTAFALPVLCYLYVGWFALRGSRPVPSGSRPLAPIFEGPGET